MIRNRQEAVPGRKEEVISSRVADSTELAAFTPELLVQRYTKIREFTEQLCESLETEDYVIQSMPDVSPTRWHLAHTTWFFETFVLGKFAADHVPFQPGYEYLFNSYYNTVGQQFPRPRRGLLSRPTVDEVFAYRHTIDLQLLEFLSKCDSPTFDRVARTINLGLHHEQQHQELMLTDIKHVLSCNPLYPVFRPSDGTTQAAAGPPMDWLDYDAELTEIGHGGDGFAFDNESPRHRVFIPQRQLGSRLITNGEYLEFIEDNGYRRPAGWLSAGWALVDEQQWSAPLYWVQQAHEWSQFTLAGLRPLDPSEPVAHVSYFEADAFARWAGARLPTEAEWEFAGSDLSRAGNFVEDEVFHPLPPGCDDGDGPTQMFGDVWEWTSSPYTAYPGYEPPLGALGEYNGKFMCNQYVLRGGSWATSRSHIRATYRNFFPPEARWQITGIRLAR